MKLNIEEWVNKQGFTYSIKQQFDESIICFKVGAYKAALLFSYLGFMSIIKERLLKSKMPSGFPEGKWKQVMEHIQDVEQWDKKVYEYIQMKKPQSLFNIPDSTRREIEYWRDKRNDCAHYKNESIDMYHVESIWSFIQRNSSKITVDGGKDALIEKLKNHFDISLTPKDTPYDDLIIEIEVSVEKNELADFFEKLLTILNELYPYEKKYVEVFKKIFDTHNDHIKEKLIEFLSKDIGLSLGFLRLNPQYLLSFNFPKEAIRQLWFKDLFSSYENDFPIYVALLQNNLINKDELKEAHEKIISRMNNDDLTDYHLQILSDSGFLEVFHDNHVYHNGYFDYKLGNRYASVFTGYIKQFGFSEKIVQSLCKNFTNEPRPPRYLRNRVQKLLKENENLQKELKSVADKLQISIPDIFKIEENE